MATKIDADRTVPVHSVHQRLSMKKSLWTQHCHFGTKDFQRHRREDGRPRITIYHVWS